jgi:hypothetical protein
LLCAICGVRKARRSCPGVHGEICTICCAEGREETIECPLDCEYLRDAHLHEKRPALDPETMPNRDIEIEESFVMSNSRAITLVALSLHDVVSTMPSVTDRDIREALAALIESLRTLRSGVIYNPRPDNLYAAQIADGVRERIEVVLRSEREATGSITSSVPDSAILKAMVFLQWLEYSHDNGRRRCRAFMTILDDLNAKAPGEEPDPDDVSRLIL